MSDIPYVQPTHLNLCLEWLGWPASGVDGAIHLSHSTRCSFGGTCAPHRDLKLSNDHDGDDTLTPK